MENAHKELDNADKKNYNTEYLPTKCRVTKPPPPKPATNPLQFVKVAPCPLYQKAQEQIKKVEEIKIARKEVRDEVEDWQQNLDNWKSSRRKRQEHIIERVVEVKKFEQEEQGRTRRKSKTFNQMMEERNIGRHKFNIPIYNADDSNDLSDYGIGSSSSKTNSVKEVDTDDNSSVLDEKDNNMYDYTSNKDTSSASNQSQSEDETNIKTKPDATKTEKADTTTKSNLYTSNLNANLATTPTRSSSRISTFENSKFNLTEPTPEKEQYTYEGAIQDYRSRIRSKINIDESIFSKPQDYMKSKEFTEVQTIVPKGNIFKRKEIFEIEKPIEENNISRRLSEDFANTISIKERLQSLEKCTDQSLKSVDKNVSQIGSVKARLQNFNKQNEADTKNNNTKPKPLRNDVANNNATKISNYLLERSNSTSCFENNKVNSTNDWRNKEIFDRSSSPEAELYMNKLNMFSRDLDNLMFNKPLHNTENGLDDYVRNSNYPPSTSSTELMTLSSDREDSGIHTADVSCSVSQADEPFEDTDISSTIPNCIEKLTIVKENEFQDQAGASEQSKDSYNEIENQSNTVDSTRMYNNNSYSLDYLKEATQDFLNEESKDSSENLLQFFKPRGETIETKTNTDVFSRENPTNDFYALRHDENDDGLKRNEEGESEKQIIKDLPEKKPVIYENVEIKLYENISFPVEFITDGVFANLAPPKLEPPKVKPPPPPPQDIYENEEQTDGNFRRLNSTKRIKKEIYIKRSSFLGLDEPTDDQIDPDIPIDKPPDINSFLQKESRFEKSMYKKLQGSRDGGFSEVESQDSGLEIERGRLSSDTWCSSLIDSSTPVHDRQDSEQTNSFTSEEDEIIKKEREIIELVEKEEKSRDSDYSSQHALSPVNNKLINSCGNNLGSEKFDRPYFPPRSGFENILSDQDSEVLRVEHELLQLEREELKRQRENIIFRENRAKFCQNRHSLENICDDMDVYQYRDGVNYRKSMPELQHVPIEYRKSLPDVPSYKSEAEFQYRKSMPDIQHAYNRSVNEYCNNIVQNDGMHHPHIEHKKSMPELQDIQRLGFQSSPPVNRQPIMAGKPIRPLTKEQCDKERFVILNPQESDAFQQTNKQIRPLTRHSLHALSAAPRPRHMPNDNWIQPKQNNEVKNYNQHWLFQEAELRRIAEQNNPSQRSSWQQPPPRQDKHIPDSVIQSLTQRVQNRTSVNERSPVVRSFKPENSPNKEFVHHPYLGHAQTFGHALPMSYPPPVQVEDSQDKMLSVSGKKKCSNCGNELGRGAAMIIESLCLFYHMDCFKCCVCHMQLGDGLIGTDVRVRNHKLHCHNCYSSEDGVKFSCV